MFIFFSVRRRVSFYPLKFSWYFLFSHSKLWLATATHNFKWVKITHIFLIETKYF